MKNHTKMYYNIKVNEDDSPLMTKKAIKWWST